MTKVAHMKARTFDRYALQQKKLEISNDKLNQRQKDDTVNQTITSGYGSAYGQPFVVAASISSTGMRLMVDDRVVGSVAGDVRLASFDAASKAFFGQDVAGGNRYKGSMIQSAVYPFELSEVQVREIGRRMRQARNV